MLVPEPPITIGVPIIQGHGVRKSTRLSSELRPSPQLHKKIGDTVVATYGSKNGSTIFPRPA